MAYTYSISPTQILTELATYTANVTAYDATTKIITVDTPVSISMGVNETVGDVTSQYSLTGNITSVAKAIQDGTSLSQLSTDEGGNFVGIFNVPVGTFQTGQRVFRVDNRSVASDPTSATTFAEATFTASGLSTTSQKLEFAPSIDAAAGTFTQVSQRSRQLISTIRTFTPLDPIAQSFLISKDNYPNGIFISSVKVFFFSKPASSIPVKLSVVNTLNGYPNGKKLDYSTVVLTADQVITSRNPHYKDPTTYTEFMFETPIYIQPGILYAFMLETSSPEYQVYYAQQNTLAVPSTAKENPTDSNPTNPTKIGASPYVGALFESQNGITWTADQTKNMMFVVDRCVFNTTVSPTIQFSIPKGLPNRKLGTNDIQHSVNANNVSNLFGNFSQQTWADAVNLTTTDFVPQGTGINYGYSAILADGNIPVGPFQTFPGKLGSPTPDDIEFDDGLGQRALLKNIDNTFSLFATLNSNDPNVSPIISDDGTTMYNVINVINNMGIQNNVISLVSGGSGYTDVVNTTITISNPDVGSDIAVLGLTVANNGTTNTVSSVYVVYPGSGYITSPTINIYGSNTSTASAIVYGETSSRGGNSFAKYFTKKVVLTPVNESADLRVYYTAYKPIGTRIDIYYKILNRNDTQIFEDGEWQLMTETNNGNVFSTSKNNLIEYEYAPGTNNQPDNSISYVSVSGQTYTTFNQFAIKVVMSSSDSTIVPFLTDIRALALPSGTGI
jgi:hypothetical protein